MSLFWHLEGGSSVSLLGRVAVSWLSLPGVPATSSIFRNSSSSIPRTVALMMLLPKKLSLKRGSSIVAIASSWFCSVPANLDFTDVVISCFIVQVPVSSSCLSKDLSSTQMWVSQWTMSPSPLRVSGWFQRPAPSSWPSPTGLLLDVGCCFQQHMQPRPSFVPR